MGLGARWLVSFALLILPIAVTLGVLIGIDSQRKSGGQAPLFPPDKGPHGKGGKNGVDHIKICNKAYGIEASSKTLDYIMNPNPWGVAKGEKGNICMNVNVFNNKSYATDNTFPAWSTTWFYPLVRDTQPVHAYPNAQEDKILPEKLENIKSIDYDVEWTYVMGKKNSSTTSEVDTLVSNGVVANVAIDMFLDADVKRAVDSSKAAHEIMVWFAQIGSGAKPLGFQEVVNTTTINGVQFDLHVAENKVDVGGGKIQLTLTWVAAATTEKFKGDIYPLIDIILNMDDATYPKSSDYLGTMAFGSEAYSSSKNVTFTVPLLSIDVQKTTASK